jgi:hypothetical protein
MCLTNQALRQEDIWESVCINTHILDLGTSWRWVLSFTSRRLYPRIKSLPVPIGQETGRTPEPVWTSLRWEKCFPCRDSNSDPSAVQPITSRYYNCDIPAPRMRGWLMNNESERIWKERSWPSRDTIQEFAWRDWWKWRKNSVRIVCISAEILTEDLRNMSRKCYCQTSLLSPNLCYDTDWWSSSEVHGKM